MDIEVRKQGDLQQRWSKLDQDRSTILTNAEEYADWTLPYVFPRSNVTTQELQLSKDSIGAQAVNHLSNKVVAILFPAQRLFLRLTVDEIIKQKAAAALRANGAPDAEAAQAGVATAISELESQLSSTEKQVQDHMNMVGFRPEAVTAAKLLIVTGNALEYHPKEGSPQIYSMRNYVVVRDLSGTVIEILTKESKSFETFKPEIQAQLRARKVPGATNKEYENDTEVTIYTQIKLEDDGKYHVLQAANDIALTMPNAVFYTKEKLPWIVLTWNLIRGENYGRGLVADYAGAFHAINVLSGSLLNIAAIMGDIKFLVNPSSLVDIVQMNAAPAGSYHPGRKDDITVITIDKLADAQFISALIERYERQIAQAFLLNSSLTRDAERVTAEEIRAQANELETSNGGIYSRLASIWQVPLAHIYLDQIGFKGLGDGITPRIITGMDSLSRAGELDNIRLFLGDLALLNGVPEDVRAVLKLNAYIKLVGTNRQVEYQGLVKTDAELQQEANVRMQQQQQLQNNEANGQAQVAGAKEAMKGQP